jgi:hypothetical protein
MAVTVALRRLTPQPFAPGCAPRRFRMCPMPTEKAPNLDLGYDLISRER